MTLMNAHIDPKRVAHHFAKARDSYDKSAIVQQKMCQRLMQMLSSVLPTIQPKRVLEIGCGSGGLTKLYAQRWAIDEWYLNDLYDAGLVYDAKRLIGDIERLDLPKVDMVLSSSALQWVKDLPSLFQKLHGALSKRGVLAFASFGRQNLHQIKALTGVGLDYHDADDIKTMLGLVGFDIIATDQYQQTLHFTHPKDILRHIKDTGVSVGGQAWTRSSLTSFYENYGQFATDKGYPLTYDPLFVVAVKR